MEPETYSAGVRALDRSLFAGDGIPAGKLVEIYGAPDSGKTALALWYCRTLQDVDPEASVGWVWTECSPSVESLRDWAGLDLERVVIVPPAPPLSGLDLARCLIEGGCRLVVIDSLAGLVELRSPENLGILTRILGRGLPPLARAAEAAGAVVLLLNQERQFQGVRYQVGASPTLTRWIDGRIRLRAGHLLRRGATPIGVRISFSVEKGGRPGAPPSGRYNLSFDGGLSDLKQVTVALPGREAFNLPV